jgi:hypothetical protein
VSTVVIVAVVVVVIGMVVTRQLRGEPLRGKRVVVLPAVLIVIGLVNLHGARHVRPVDVVCIAVSALIAGWLGIRQGAVMWLERRDGGLWGQLPRRGLWLWAALIASRIVISVIAALLGAKIATSTDSVILVLGINRLAQAAVIAARAVAAGVPFSPEKDGKVFLPGLMAGQDDGSPRARYGYGRAPAPFPLNGPKLGQVFSRLASGYGNRP